MGLINRVFAFGHWLGVAEENWGREAEGKRRLMLGFISLCPLITVTARPQVIA